MNDLMKVGMIAGTAYGVAKPHQENALLALGLGALLGYGLVQLAKSQNTRLQMDYKVHIEQNSQLGR